MSLNFNKCCPFHILFSECGGQTTNCPQFGFVSYSWQSTSRRHLRSSGKKTNENFPMWTLAFSLWSQREIGQQEFPSWHQVFWHANFQQFSNHLEAQWSILLSGDNGFSNYMRNRLDLLPFKCIYIVLKKYVRSYSCCHWSIISTCKNLGFVSVFVRVEFFFVCLLWFFCWLVGFNRFFQAKELLKVYL